ncbi:MAG: hypothetical protein M0036_19105 [Desulfobacteraceae bacterium]|nr:hypothetical protein [Desulfobacteraceae bacterium]
MKSQPQNEKTGRQPTGLHPIQIPRDITLWDVVRFMQDKGVEFRVDSGTLAYKTPGGINPSALVRYIKTNHHKILSLIGGCEHCSAYAQSPSGPACFYNAYFLGKAGPHTELNAARANCKLKSLPII